MVHNAGITRDKTFGKMKEEGFRSVIDVNLGSIIRLDKMLLSRSKGVMQDGSRLVYLSSIAGEQMEATPLLPVSAIYVTCVCPLVCVCANRHSWRVRADQLLLLKGWSDGIC